MLLIALEGLALSEESGDNVDIWLSVCGWNEMEIKGEPCVCLQGVTAWTVRATQSWAPPQKTPQSLGSVMPARTESPPAVSCVPTKMASSRRQMLGGGFLSHTDPAASWHSQEAASGTCRGTNNAAVNDLGCLICWGQRKWNGTHSVCWEEKKVGLRQTERERIHRATRAGDGGKSRDRGREGMREKSVLCEAWRLQPRYRW